MKARSQYYNKIYPFYQFEVARVMGYGDVHLQGEITTYIRKRFEGKYYITKMCLSYGIPMNETGFPSKIIKSDVPELYVENEMLKMLIRNAYNWILFGKVIINTELEDLYGRPINAELDLDQSTERERLLYK